MRYLKALENKDISLVHSMIALVRYITISTLWTDDKFNQSFYNNIIGIVHDEIE